MTSIILPDTYTAPQFQFGQIVYIKGTENEPYTVIGMTFITRGRFEQPYWTYQVTDRPAYSILHIFKAYYGYDLLADELSAEPWPIEGETCPGMQFPCGKPAAYWDTTWTGSDMETRRSVDLAYCPDCWRERQRIEREAAESVETR